MTPPESVLTSSYHLQRGDQTHGPYTQEDLRSYLLYGTVKPADAVWDETQQAWLTIQDILGSPDSPGHTPEPETSRWQVLVKKALALLTATPQSKQPAVPRRIVRYRDYGKVPPRQRSGRVLMHLLVGSILYPPWLWASCATLFSQRVFRNKQDDQGYLRLLSSKFEVLAAVLLVLNTLGIAVALWFFTTAVWPEITRLANSALTAAQDLLDEMLPPSDG